jgi:hypothetical protein
MMEDGRLARPAGGGRPASIMGEQFQHFHPEFFPSNKPGT